MPFPTSPSWGYRVTQGLHVTTGTAAVPLLLVKLWIGLPAGCSPGRPATRRELLARTPPSGSRSGCWWRRRSSSSPPASPTPRSGTRGTFSFRATHYAIAWVAIGALVVHIAVKLPVIRAALGADVDDTAHDRPAATEPGVLTRRGLLRTTWLAAGVAVLATAGSTVPAAARVSVLRRPLRRRAAGHPDQQVRPRPPGHRDGRQRRRTGSTWGTATGEVA